jgi:sulfonate transport system substrate-binding protein
MPFSFLRTLLKISVVLAFAWQVPAQAEEAPKVLSIGVTGPGHLNFIVGQDQQIFEKALAAQGTKVEYLVFSNGGAAVQTALASGSLDVAYTGASPALRLATKKGNDKLIGISEIMAAGSLSILVSAKSPLTKLQDIKGKKVAYLTGTIRQEVLVKILRSVGLTLQDIDSFNMDVGTSAPALARGDIDALAEGNTTVAGLIAKGFNGRVLYNSSTHPEWEVPLLITANGNFVKKYPATVVKFLQADKQVAEWTNEHFDQAMTIYGKAIGIPPEIVRRQYPQRRINNAPLITDQVLNTLHDEVKFMKETKLLDGDVDFNAWVDRSYVDAVYRAQR